jgi:hypothetical protein
VPLLLSLIVGAVDRVNKRKLMAAIDAANGTITLAFIVLTLLGHQSVFAIGVVMMLLGVTSSIEATTVMACIPRDTGRKVGTGKRNYQRNRFLRADAVPVLSGVLYGVIGLNALLIISCAAFSWFPSWSGFCIPFTKREQKKHIVPTIINDMKGCPESITLDSSMFHRATKMNIVLFFIEFVRYYPRFYAVSFPGIRYSWFM